MEPKWNMAVTAKKIDSLVNALSKARCEYLIVDDAYLSTLDHPNFASDNHGEPLLIGDAYMVITCANGYKILMENSVLANLTRRFLNDCTVDSDYQNVSFLRFIYNISLTNEKEDT